MNVYFCAGDYCPGLRWPASETPHPSSCAFERMNSPESLREAAESRRANDRDVDFDVPEEPERKTRRLYQVFPGHPSEPPDWKDLPVEDYEDELDDAGFEEDWL